MPHRKRQLVSGHVIMPSPSTSASSTAISRAQKAPPLSAQSSPLSSPPTPATALPNERPLSQKPLQAKKSAFEQSCFGSAIEPTPCSSSKTSSNLIFSPRPSSLTCSRRLAPSTVPTKSGSALERVGRLPSGGNVVLSPHCHGNKCEDEIKDMSARKDQAWSRKLAPSTVPTMSGSALERVQKRGPKPKKEPKPPKEKKPQQQKKKTEGAALIGIDVNKEVDQLGEWYQQVITNGGTTSYDDVAGCYILEPGSYAIWESIKDFFDKKISTVKVKNCYFPIFISADNLEREKEHIEGFAAEVAWVTKGGKAKTRVLAKKQATTQPLTRRP
ncbi:hypothetical protein BU16DRAFT_557408 [Lophium mytilinum]|uniref:Uncharacterized protein n=1 Tax=Lophium mytilinum TaxID=390894 RepID=A0A6A6R2X0_9PEZI|nr:hypothetical protein BU16DRAFT_557408 [Lophium mytilinum]